MMEMLVLALFLALVPLVSSFDKEPGLLELGLLAKYPEYQAVVRPFKKRNGGLNFKRNGGVPDECRGKYDTSIYTQVNCSTYYLLFICERKQVLNGCYFKQCHLGDSSIIIFTMGRSVYAIESATRLN